MEASAAAFTASYGEFQRTASRQEPAYRFRDILTDGFDSTTSSLRTLFPGARLGFCLHHALLKLPKKLVAIASPVRRSLLSFGGGSEEGDELPDVGETLQVLDHVAHPVDVRG